MGTAYAASSRVWFTFWNGIVTEVYYPTVDRPQLRDLQYLITDGTSFFHDEKRDLKSTLERLADHVLGYRCTNSDPAGQYAIVKEIIADPIPAPLRAWSGHSWSGRSRVWFRSAMSGLSPGLIAIRLRAGAG